MEHIRYISLCSGIEAFSCAVSAMQEYSPVAFSEIERFPCKVLQHHYTNVPNLGDMTKIDGRKYAGTVDLVVGGTPCQGFSVAGKRGGLDDERSGLARDYIRLVQETECRWFIWENVPGCLSTSSGKDFIEFVTALEDIGYGVAWRVLDAQFTGVPQRRRRVFLVGYFGDWHPAAAVLFERESLRGNTAPRKEAGKEIAKCITTGIGGRLDPETDTFVTGPIAKTLTASPCRNDPTVDTLLYRKMNPHGGCYTEDGTAGTITRRDYKDATDLIVDTPQYYVRRLTPLECERLQGFPDGYTDVQGASDTVRYKALGNSMAVTCMRWIAKCVLMANAIVNSVVTRNN